MSAITVGQNEAKFTVYSGIFSNSCIYLPAIEAGLIILQINLLSLYEMDFRGFPENHFMQLIKQSY
jgi:hypothetical protein